MYTKWVKMLCMAGVYDQEWNSKVRYVSVLPLKQKAAVLGLLVYAWWWIIASGCIKRVMNIKCWILTDLLVYGPVAQCWHRAHCAGLVLSFELYILFQFVSQDRKACNSCSVAPCYALVGLRAELWTLDLILNLMWMYYNVWENEMLSLTYEIMLFIMYMVPENMKLKNTSGVQTEPKYAICCSCWYL